MPAAAATRSESEPSSASGAFVKRAIPAERLLALGAASVLVVAVLRLGWMSDDAFISLRAVQNFVLGHGLVSNPGERVQGFTNPLWVFVLIGPYALLRNAYWTAISISLACTIACAWLIARRRDAGFTPAVALLLLAASHSLAVFSTSGLENTLAHALLAAFVLEGFRGGAARPWLRSLLAGLIVLNRLDHALLVLPAWIVDARALGVRRTLRFGWLGLAPVAAWLGLATFYYGFPFPNTAYAKLNLEIRRGDVLLQGASYLVDATLRDPIVPAVIVLGMLVVARRSRPERSIAAALGVVAYLAYIVSIGGDFMSGRFLTAPYLVMVLLLAEALRVAPPLASGAVAGVALLLALPGLGRMPADFKPTCVVPPSGIVDERDCYVEHTGIAQNFRNPKYKTHPYFQSGVKWRAGTGIEVSTLVGLAGVAAGPRVHVIDPYGLTDPLIARIRFDGTRDFRIGHLGRTAPDGYVESVEQGANRLSDPCLRALYDDLQLITRSQLLAPGRLAAIWRANFVRRSCRAPG